MRSPPGSGGGVMRLYGAWGWADCAPTHASSRSPRSRNMVAEDTFRSDVFVRDARPVADLALTLADSPDPATVRGNLTYKATITNGGAAEATGVTLVAEFAADASITSTTGATCTARVRRPAASSPARSARIRCIHDGDYRRPAEERSHADAQGASPARAAGSGPFEQHRHRIHHRRPLTRGS